MNGMTSDEVKTEHDDNDDDDVIINHGSMIKYISERSNLDALGVEHTHVAQAVDAVVRSRTVKQHDE